MAAPLIAEDHFACHAVANLTAIECSTVGESASIDGVDAKDTKEIRRNPAAWHLFGDAVAALGDQRCRLGDRHCLKDRERSCQETKLLG